jgi:hypothetical protein
MAIDNKPTFVIVPGAWHPSSCYETLIERLSRSGYPVEIVDLPSLDPTDIEDTTCGKDAQVVNKKLLSLVEEGKQVIVVPHSYGGIPGGAGAHGLGIQTREKEGKKGGVIGLIYLCAFIVTEGMTLIEFLGGRHAPYVQNDSVSSHFFLRLLGLTQ